jgi:hypothetical protein
MKKKEEEEAKATERDIEAKAKTNDRLIDQYKVVVRENGRHDVLTVT